MYFCPFDGTILLVGVVPTMDTTNHHDQNHFFCSTCPYSCAIAHTRSVTTVMDPSQRKQVDDILGGAAAWANVDRTSTVCPACNHGQAYFLQIQIRSADEPMTIFYKCVQCSNQWNDK